MFGSSSAIKYIRDDKEFEAVMIGQSNPYKLLISYVTLVMRQSVFLNCEPGFYLTLINGNNQGYHFSLPDFLNVFLLLEIPVGRCSPNIILLKYSCIGVETLKLNRKESPLDNFSTFLRVTKGYYIEVSRTISETASLISKDVKSSE